MEIRQGGLDDPKVIALLDAHLRWTAAQSPPESVHALDLSGLMAPEVRFWSVWESDDVLGVGALKRLSADHGEVKSMHTAAAGRRRGVASLMLRHIIDSARGMGFSRLSLETGAMDMFSPAHALYRRHGFEECGPFGGYREDPYSRFMRLELAPA